VAQHDVTDGEALVPEQDALILALAAGFKARHHFANFTIDMLGAQLTGLHQPRELPIL
jgi:hypothetical protein